MAITEKSSTLHLRGTTGGIEPAQAVLDGGIIIKSMPFYAGDGKVALKGAWSGGDWNPRNPFIARQYRGKTPIGIWKIVGIDLISRNREDAVLIAEPSGDYLTPVKDDILVFGSGQFSILPVEHSSLQLTSHSAIEFGLHRYHGVALAENRIIERVLIFHGPEAAIDRTSNQLLWRSGIAYPTRISLPAIEDRGEFVLQVTLDGAITAQRVIKTLQHIRSFSLDAGQEMFFKYPATSGKRIRQAYDYFEPTVEASPGSLNLFIEPAKPKQIPLFAEPAEPLKLLSSILSAAERGDVSGAVVPLMESVFSVDRLLKDVIQLVEASRYDKLSFRAPGSDREFVVGRDAALTLRQGVRELETRELHRNGLLYGVDIIRHWCRVRVDDEAKGSEDWTLHYPQSLSDAIKGTVPREVTVNFKTQTRPGLKTGTGTIVTIESKN